MYGDSAGAASSSAKSDAALPKKRGKRAARDAEADDGFEDAIRPAAAKRASTAATTKAAADGSAASGKQANGTTSSKKAVVEWHDEDDDEDSSLVAKAAKRKQSKADKAKASKRRKTEDKAPTPSAPALPQPPTLPTPSEPIFSASSSSSSSSCSPSLSRDLYSFIAATLRGDVAELEAVYGQPDSTSLSSSSSSSSQQQQQQPHSYVTALLAQLTDSFLAALSAHLQPAPASSSSSSSSPAKQAATSASDDATAAPSPLLAFYSSLVALMPARVEQVKLYAASLSKHATLPSPNLTAADTALSSSASASARSASSSSSPSPQPLSSLIQSGFSSLSINTDVVLGELKERKRELESKRAWREAVTERINKQVTGDTDTSRGDEGDGAAEDAEVTETTRKNRLIKRIIKGSGS